MFRRSEFSRSLFPIKRKNTVYFVFLPRHSEGPLPVSCFRVRPRGLAPPPQNQHVIPRRWKLLLVMRGCDAHLHATTPNVKSSCMQQHTSHGYMYSNTKISAPRTHVYTHLSRTHEKLSNKPSRVGVSFQTLTWPISLLIRV